MLETSSDLLIIVGAFCLLVFTGFLCYLIYSLTKIVQESKKTVEDVNKKMEKLNPVIDNTTMTISSLMQKDKGSQNYPCCHHRLDADAATILTRWDHQQSVLDAPLA